MVPPGRVRATFLFDGIDHPMRIASTSLFDAGGPSGPAVFQQSPVLLAYYELDVLGNVRRLRAPGGLPAASGQIQWTFAPLNSNGASANG